MDFLEAVLVVAWLLLLLAVSIALGAATLFRRPARPITEEDADCFVERALPQQMSDLKPLVKHYLCAGVVDVRQADQLPIDRPLAPEGPQPSVVRLSKVLPLLAPEAGKVP